MKVLSAVCLMFLLHFPASTFAQETYNLSSLETKITVTGTRIACTANHCRIEKKKSIDLPTQGGLTATARLEDGNVQIIWNARNASGKIKIFSVTLDPSLNQIGPIVTFPQNLTAYSNLNILPGGDFFSYDLHNNVVVQGRNKTNGRGFGPPRTLFPNPPGADPYDTTFSWWNGTHHYYYNSLFYAATSGRYGGLWGDYPSQTYDVAVGFNGRVVSTDSVADPITTNDVEFENWLYMESRSGKYGILNRRINTETAQPGNAVTQVPFQANNLGAAEFFNPFTVCPGVNDPGIAGRRTRRLPRGAPVPSVSNKAWVFYVRNIAGASSSNLMYYPFNTHTGKRNGPIQKLDGIDPSFYYGLDCTSLDEEVIQ